MSDAIHKILILICHLDFQTRFKIIIFALAYKWFYFFLSIKAGGLIWTGKCMKCGCNVYPKSLDKVQIKSLSWPASWNWNKLNIFPSLIYSYLLKK